MLYLGCDVHRDYTTICCVDEAGDMLATSNVSNTDAGVKQFIDQYPAADFSVVLEAGLNWGMMYDLFESLVSVKHVVLAHPPRVKAIAAAKIKTDKIDARILAQLLRVGLIPEVWIPPKEVRVLKDMVRCRAFAVKVKTMLKNRIHDLLRKAHAVPPDVKDLFGSYGRQWLNEMKLSDARLDRLLRMQLSLLDTFDTTEQNTRHWITHELQNNDNLRVVKTIPGIGEVMGAVVVLEIDNVHRFPDARHLHAYCGLTPSTHASGQTRYHGRLIRGNKWLRWAFVEAAHTSIRVSPYFRSHYNRVRMHAGTQAASISCARKLATVTYAVLKEKRPYREINIGENNSRLPSVKSSLLGSGRE